MTPEEPQTTPEQTAVETPVVETPAVETPVETPVERASNDPNRSLGQRLFDEPKPAEVAPTQVPEVAPQVSPTTPAPAQQTPQTFTQEQVQQMLQQQAAQTAQPTAQPAQQAPMSQEEINKALKYASVNAETYDAIFESESKEDSMKALEAYGQAIVQNALTAANYLQQEQLQNLQQQLNPYMSFADQQREMALQQEFYGANPELKGMEVLVDSAIAQLQTTQKQYKSPQELFTDVKTLVQSHLAVMQGGQPQTAQPQSTAAPQPPQTPVQQKPAMATLSTGGQGGAGQTAGSSSSTPGQNTAKKLFG